MRTTTRNPVKRPSASPTKSSGYHPRQQQHPVAADPASIQALMYAQQPQGWMGFDHRVGYAPGPLAHYTPNGATGTVPTIDYPGGIPRAHMLAANQFHAQQALALQQAQLAQQAHLAQQAQLVQQQAQLAQHGYVQPQILQLVHPPMDILPPRDNFVYVQSELQEEVDTKLMETIKKRALFVAPPLGRLRIAQACERCRKRKTRCTGEKPACKRCSKRGYECEYVFEHRANKTKKALAEQEAAREAEAAAVLNGDIPAAYPETSALPCPPAGPTNSSSSGYSAASASSLPPPRMFAGHSGQPLFPQGVSPYSSSAGYSTGSLQSALPTPAIMVEGRPIISAHMRPQAPPAPAPPASRSRAGSRAKRPQATPASSVNDMHAVSRSTSALSVQHSDMPLPAASSSCQACLSEMASCTACDMEKASMHHGQHYNDGHGTQSPSIPIDSLLCGPFPPSPPPEVKQHLLNAVNKALAKQAAGRAHTTSPAGHPSMPPVPPLLSRGEGSSSSSGSDAQSQSGLQTPGDYFAYPGFGMPAGSGTDMLSPAGYSAGVVKTSESMGASYAHQGMYGAPWGAAPQAPGCGVEEEGGMQFSDYFHSFDQVASDSESMQSFYGSEY